MKDGRREEKKKSEHTSFTECKSPLCFAAKSLSRSSSLCCRIVPHMAFWSIFASFPPGKREREEGKRDKGGKG